MPEVAAFMERLRTAFGDEAIDEAARRGKPGEATFYARENGRAVGTASPTHENAWCVDADVQDRHYCPGCDGGCIGEGVRCAEWLKRMKTEN
nr:hypothetical protein [Caballeronia sp. SBC1]